MTKEPIHIARPPLLRQTNAQVLLNLLRETGGCSKADLVRASGLSAPTVANVVALLASAGLVETIGEGDSTGGRRPDMLRFRAERGCVVGAEIRPDSLRFLLAHLDGRELGRAKVTLSKASSTPSAVCSVMGKEVRNLLRKHRHREEQLLGFVIGVPAIVDVKEGIVVSLSPLTGWRNVPLGPMLRSELPCEVIVENDTNLAAQGEYNRGAAQGEQNFVFIIVGEGVGAGIFVEGKIYHGSQWSAGEIGYLRIPNISRANPTLHGYGRLEKVLGASGILRSWRASSQRARTHPRVARASAIFDLAAAGNAQAKRILTQRASILADVVLDLALILNPSIILLGGDVGSHPRLLQEVNTLLEGSEMKVRVRRGALSDTAVLWGAISTAVDSAMVRLIQGS